MPRVMEIVAPLGADVLLFHRLRGREELSRLSEFEIDLLSARGDINLDQIMAKNVTVKLELPNRRTRYFNGFVTRFAQSGVHGRYFLYRATVRPWLWFLTRTSNCRIFQELTVPDIIKNVFDEHSIADCKSQLTATYAKRTYCVQYRETDFNFVCRLMEEEGIYFYFKHVEGRHTLILADSYSAHSPIEGYEQIPFVGLERTTRLEQEYINEWTFAREVQPGRYCLDEFDFEKPSADLKVSTTHKRNYELSDYELFDAPGEYLTIGDGEHYVGIRLDEQQYQFELAHAKCNARGVSVGSLFKLTGQQRTDQNREYLVLSADYELEYTEYEAMENTGAQFNCAFIALHSRQQFRPRRTTPRPFLQGPQTAIVVGPSGDEIYTDKYGRVKVQFHWDRYGKKNENSSCWMRVSHPWAGKNWGMVAIPRIGQEVIVDFLEGDPDQPIITGRVYNAEQMPPWDLPGNATQSGILSRSSKGGSGANANAIRMEDKKGAEQLWIHAEKNQDIEVENDETHWVGHDRKKNIDNDETTHVKHDRKETVDNNETITIHGARTETVDKDETITIHGARTETVDKDETITINGGRTETVAKDESITISGGRTESVAKDETITINGGRTETVARDESITISGGRTQNVSKAESVTVGEKRTVSVGKDDALAVGKNLTINAGDSVTITTGSASISMKKDGTITIRGKDITIDGSGKINIKAGGDIVMKGSKILQN